MRLDQDTLLKLRSTYLTAEDAVFLYLFATGQTNTYVLDEPSGRIEKLATMGLISQGKLTSYGASFLSSLLSQEENNWEVITSYSDDFVSFWKTFPSTDGFGNFPATRTIRSSKKDAYNEWRKRIEEGFTPEQMIEGLRKEVEARKNSSTFKGGNNLRFIKSPVNYLKSRAFLDYEEQDENEDIGNDTNYA